MADQYNNTMSLKHQEEVKPHAGCATAATPHVVCSVDEHNKSLFLSHIEWPA